MKSNMIWASLIHLSTHMWDDESCPPQSWYCPSDWTVNNDVDLDIWDNTVKYLAETGVNTVVVDVGDAVRYETHPEICAPDAWSKDFLKKKLDEIRALGMTPIPKLNFSTTHDTWLKEYRRMVSTPTYYTVCADLIREVCEIFGNPALFHLGFDEEKWIFFKSKDMIRVRNDELWMNDLNFLAKECEKYGARPWIWSDFVWEHKDFFLANMSKSILQSNWYYLRFKSFPEPNDNNKHIASYNLLEEHGFDQVPTCSTWNNVFNSEETMAHGKKYISPEHLKGYMTASWATCRPGAKYDLMSDAERFYYARKKYYPDTL